MTSPSHIPTEQRIEEIRARLAEITPGPWAVETDGARVWHMGSGGTICEVNFDQQTGDHQPGEDQAFIANAPSDIAYLLEQLDSIPAQIQAAVEEATGQYSSDPSKVLVPMTEIARAVEAERVQLGRQISAIKTPEPPRKWSEECGGLYDDLYGAAYQAGVSATLSVVAFTAIRARGAK